MIDKLNTDRQQKEAKRKDGQDVEGGRLIRDLLVASGGGGRPRSNQAVALDMAGRDRGGGETYSI